MEPASGFSGLPERCSQVRLVKAFVCHRNVNTCEILAGENTSWLNCGLYWLRTCRCCKFCWRKTSHEEGSSNSRLSGETAAACCCRCRVWLHWLERKAVISCLEKKHNFYAQFNSFEMKLQTEVVSKFAVLIPCALVEPYKPFLFS